MNNQKVDEDVRWVVRVAVNDAVYRAASAAVNGALGGAVYGAASRAVYETMYWALGDSKHPALQDFLRSAGADVGARRT